MGKCKFYDALDVVCSLFGLNNLFAVDSLGLMRQVHSNMNVERDVFRAPTSFALLGPVFRENLPRKLFPSFTFFQANLERLITFYSIFSASVERGEKKIQKLNWTFANNKPTED